DSPSAHLSRSQYKRSLLIHLQPPYVPPLTVKLRPAHAPPRIPGVDCSPSTPGLGCGARIAILEPPLHIGGFTPQRHTDSRLPHRLRRSLANCDIEIDPNEAPLICIPHDILSQHPRDGRCVRRILPIFAPTSA